MNAGQRIAYGLLAGSCRLTGILPDWLLYHTLAPLIRFMLYRVVRYRRTVVRTNLCNSFPEKGPEEITAIERGFYRTLSEVFVDTIKLAAISRSRILERMVFCNAPEVERQMAGRTWVAAMSHFGSWELTINYACYSDHEVLAVYRPLHDPVFDRYYRFARSRFGTRPVPMHEIYREVIRSQRPGGRPAAVAMIADQTPPRHEIKHWYRFLSQDTPFFSGIEKMAVRFGIPVYFLYVRKTAPLCYAGEFIQIYDGSEAVGEYEITERYVARLEAMIRETPELWMWSHKRWKHKKEDWTA